MTPQLKMKFSGRTAALKPKDGLNGPPAHASISFADFPGYFETRRKESKKSGAWSKGLPMG